MRLLAPLVVLLAAACASLPESELRSHVVEASCGQCRFGLPGEDCDLAIRFDGQAYFVDGTGIDDHGDAHAGDGFCNAVRKARVSGRVVNGRFVATAFELLPEEGQAR
ncbi:MAG: hypothetical protein JRI55_02380 [Deltaproteobacteria bacterium]|nr:hypothetical protein [Deltaproteobacteria bacterium]